jgi:hypothetical protein
LFQFFQFFLKCVFLASDEFEKDEIVACDSLFFEAVKLAANDIAELKEHVKGIVDSHLNGDRPKRERKPRILTY